MATLAKKAVDPVVDLDRVTIRFAGDSGDGMQLAGTQFTKTSAVYGDVPPILSNQIRTIPGIQSTTSLVSFPQ